MYSSELDNPLRFASVDAGVTSFATAQRLKMLKGEME